MLAKVKLVLNRIKNIRDFKFQHVPASTAYTMFLFGLIHFIAIASAYVDLNQIQQYNWGIFKSLGLADSWQLPLMTGVMIFDLFLAIYGWYLIRHIEPRNKKNDLPDKDSLR